MTTDSFNHPAKTQLIAFGQGKLAAEESSSVEQHLEVCRECCETLLDLKDDTFVGLVKIAQPSDADRRMAALGRPEVATSARVEVEQAQTAGGGHPTNRSESSPTVLVQSGESISADELPPELAEHPRYRIVELIGRGGMGNVYRAEHRLMNRAVAIKLINSQLMQHPQAVERFRREVQAAAKLSHPNIVAAYDAEQAGNAHFLVMEFVEGTDLASVVKQRGPMSVAEACECIRQAAAGMQHAHEKGMVHRDIKPHNLMLSRESRVESREEGSSGRSSSSQLTTLDARPLVRILDFGLAGFASEAAANSISRNELASGSETENADPDKPDASASRLISTAAHLTAVGSVMGTPDYMAPEQAADAHSADIRADIYSLGCTLHFFLTGKPPFEADNVLMKLKAHANEPPPSLTALRKDVPAELSKVVARMLAKNPADRFQTPAEVAAALAPFAKPAASPPKRRVRTLVAAALLGLVGLLAGVIYVEIDKGQFIVEVADDEVAVSLKSQDLKIRDATANREYVLKLGPQRMRSGEYEIIVTEPAADLEFSPSKNFSLKRGDEVRVSVRFKPKPGALANATGQDRKPLSNAMSETVTAGINGSFEVTKSGLPVEWSFYSPRTVPTGDFDIVMDQTDFKDGEQSLKFVVRKCDSTGGRLSPGFFNEFHNTKPGETYKISFWAKNAGSEFVFKARGVSALGGVPGVVIRSKETINEWRRFECIHTIPPKMWLRLELNVVQPGIFWIDDIQIVRVNEKAPAKPDSITEVGRFTGHEGSASHAIVSPGGRYGISCGADKSIRVWDIATQEEKRVLKGHEGSVFGLAISTDGKLLASGDNAKSIRLWNLETGEQVGELTGHTDAVTDLAFMPDRTHLLSAGFDSTLRLWHVADRKLVRTIDIGTFVEKMLPLPDGRRVMLSGAHTRGWGPRVYDLEKGEKIDATPNGYSCMAVSADGRMSLIGSITGVLVVRDTINDNVIVQMTDPRAAIARDRAARDAAITPDGRFAITTTREKQMYLWDLHQGKLLSTAELDSISTITLSPDGRFALTIGQGGISVWRLPESVLEPIAATGPRDEARLQGKWIAVSGHARKKPLTAAELAQLSITFDGDRVEIVSHTGPPTPQSATFTINPNRDPKQIDFVAPDKKESMPGIYQFDGNRLKLALIDQDYSRPTNLDPDHRPDHLTVTLERVPVAAALGQEEQTALKAAEAFLAVVDADKFDQLFDIGSNLAKKQVTREQILQTYQTIRNTLGRLEQRTLKRVRLIDEFIGLPAGRYAAVQFVSDFEKHKGLWETVLLNVDDDGQWRANTYAATVQPLPLPEPKKTSGPKTSEKSQRPASPTPPAAVPTGANFILDPSFENTGLTQLPRDWRAWFNDGPEFRCEVVVGGHTGQRCLQISGKGTRGVVFGNDLKADRSKRYALKGWAKFAGDKDARAVIKFNYFRGSEFLGVHDLVGVTADQPGWHLLEKTDALDAYPQADHFYAMCHVEGSGTGWFDDLELVAYDRDKLPIDFDSRHGRNNRLTGPNSLDRWVGTWETQYVFRETDNSPKETKLTMNTVSERTLGDYFLMSHAKRSPQASGVASAPRSGDEGTGGLTPPRSPGLDAEERLLFLTFDQNLGAFRQWFFSSNGKAFEWRGPWDDATKSLELRMLPDASNLFSTEHFVDADRIEARLRFQYVMGMKDAGRWTATRKAATAKVDVPTAKAHAAEPEELSQLNKFAGEWTIRATYKPSVWNPQQREETITETSTWVLGGRFLMTRAINDKSQLTSIWLATYEPSEKSNHFWFFNADGASGQWRLTWDEASRGFHFRSIDMPPGWIGTGFNRWINDDTFDNHALIKDENGRVLLDSTQEKKRNK